MCVISVFLPGLVAAQKNGWSKRITKKALFLQAEGTGECLSWSLQLSRYSTDPSGCWGVGSAQQLGIKSRS